MQLMLELQLMRSLGSVWEPRSRPSPCPVVVGAPDPVFCTLFPGPAAEGMESMMAVFEGITRSSQWWASARVALTVDARQFGEPRPALFFLGASDQPTGIVHFPVMADSSNKMFRGHHSLLIRVM